jgi:hypothetical protein
LVETPIPDRSKDTGSMIYGRGPPGWKLDEGPISKKITVKTLQRHVKEDREEIDPHRVVEPVNKNLGLKAT